MMLATPSHAAPTLVGFEQHQEQPWEALTAGISQLEMSSSEMSDDDDSLNEDVVSVVKEQGTVCTATTSLASCDESVSSHGLLLTDSAEEIDVDEVDVDALVSSVAVAVAPEEEEEEIDVDEVDVDEIDVDDIIANKAPRRFKGHRSSIVLPPQAELTTATPAVAPQESAPTPQLHRSNTAPAATRRPRSSIKLSSLQAPILLNEKRNAWMNLPKPDMERIHRVVSAPARAEGCHTEAPRAKHVVTFSDIRIRNYAQTIGDNPSVSYGPPITLDWDYEELRPIPVDDYELNRGPRRQLRQMSLNYYQRTNLLQWAFGHSEEDLKKAKKQANKDKFKRAVTKYFLPVQRLEDVAESGVRKTKRILGGKRASVAA